MIDRLVYTAHIEDSQNNQLACSSRLRRLEEEERWDSDEGELLCSGENLWESPDQSSHSPTSPRQGRLDVQVWGKSVVQWNRLQQLWLVGAGFP